jgi:hypothetical protein
MYKKFLLFLQYLRRHEKDFPALKVERARKRKRLLPMQENCFNGKYGK